MCMFRLTLFLCLVSFVSANSELKPLMNLPEKIIYSNDFSKDFKIKGSDWRPNQATQWKVNDGVLQGKESTKENQAKKDHHKGLEPRITFPALPEKCIIKLSLKLDKGSETAKVPFIELNHHVVRMRIRTGFIDLVTDSETLQVAKADFSWQDGKWYELLAERNGEEFIIQIKNGPTLYAQHPEFKNDAPSGSNGLGIAGKKSGFVEIDKVTIWEVKSKQQNWLKSKESFAEYTPVKIAEKKVKKKK